MQRIVAEKLKFRKSILNSIEDLTKYAKAYKKTAEQGQMSLFSSLEIEIKKPEIQKLDLNESDIYELLEKEEEHIGLNVTYDIFKKHILLENTLCTTTLTNVINNEKSIQDGIMLVYIYDIEMRDTKNGKRYAKLFGSRNGLKHYMYFFSDDIYTDLQNIRTKEVNLVKFRYDNNNDTIVAKKVSSVKYIDISKYIEKIGIEINNIENLTKIRNYIHFYCKDNDGVDLIYKVNGNKYPMDFKVNLQEKDVEQLYDLGCKIKIFKKL